MPVFSVIVPVYNVENYIAECLQSVLNQTCGDFECLIVDDGSRDSSVSIAEKLTDGDARFQIIHQENGGLSAARNTGIRSAQGQWLVFLDADDFLHTDALKYLSNSLAAADKMPDVIISTTYAYDEKNDSAVMREWNPIGSDFDENLMKAAFQSKNFVVAAWTLTVRREYLEKNNLWFEPGLLHEDELWVPQVMGLSEHTVINNSPFYYGRCDRVGSITSSKNIKRLTDKLYIIEKLDEIFQSDKRLHKYANLIKYRRAQIFLSVIRESGDYNDKAINVQIRRHSGVLLEAKKMKYFTVWLALEILGVRNVSALVRRMVQ